MSNKICLFFKKFWFFTEAFKLRIIEVIDLLIKLFLLFFLPIRKNLIPLVIGIFIVQIFEFLIAIYLNLKESGIRWNLVIGNTMIINFTIDDVLVKINIFANICVFNNFFEPLNYGVNSLLRFEHLFGRFIYFMDFCFCHLFLYFWKTLNKFFPYFSFSPLFLQKSNEIVNRNLFPFRFELSKLLFLFRIQIFVKLWNDLRVVIIIVCPFSSV